MPFLLAIAVLDQPRLGADADRQSPEHPDRAAPRASVPALRPLLRPARRALPRRRLAPADAPSARAAGGESAAALAVEEIPLDRWQAGKAVALTAGAIGLFLTPVPAYLTAALVAGVVLTSRRMHTRTMLGLVDWQMLALFVGLFVVDPRARALGLDRGGGARSRGRRHAARRRLGPGAGGRAARHPRRQRPGGHAAAALPARRAEVGYALALASTFAGNAVLVGSIANLIVVEQAARAGVAIGFRDHLRVGLPITLVSLALAAAALALY